MAVLVNKDTKVITQGFTGKARSIASKPQPMAPTSLVGSAWAGRYHALGSPRVQHGCGGEGSHGANASAIYVPPPFADAILEAIDAEIELAVHY